MSTTKDPQQKKAPVIQINQEVLHNNLSDETMVVATLFRI